MYLLNFSLEGEADPVLLEYQTTEEVAETQ
jgi:hypothetical protein